MSRRMQRRRKGEGVLLKDPRGNYRLAYYDKSFLPPKRKTIYLVDQEGNRITTRPAAEVAAERYLDECNKIWEINSKEEAIKRIVENKCLILSLEKNLDLIWDKFKERIYGEITHKTYSNYDWAWRKFSAFVKANHKDILEKIGITVDIMDDFFLSLRKTEFTPTSYNSIRTQLGTILEKTLGRHTRELFRNIRRLPKQPRCRQALTHDELIRMILVLQDHSPIRIEHKNEYRCFLRFMAFTSMRGEDAAHVLWNGISFDDQTITYIPIKTARVTPEPVTVPLHRELYYDICSLRKSQSQGDKYILPHIHARYHQYSGALGEDMKKVMHAAGIITQINGDKFRKYSLYTVTDTQTGQPIVRRRKICIKSMNASRHYFATQAKDKAIDRSIVKEILVHQTPEMTDHYTHVNLDDKRKAIDQMPDLVPEYGYENITDSGKQISRDEIKDFILSELPDLEYHTLYAMKEIIDTARRINRYAEELKPAIPRKSQDNFEAVLHYTNENIGKIFGISGSMVKRYMDKFNLPVKRKRIFTKFSNEKLTAIRQTLVAYEGRYN